MGRASREKAERRAAREVAERNAVPEVRQDSQITPEEGVDRRVFLVKLAAVSAVVAAGVTIALDGNDEKGTGGDRKEVVPSASSGRTPETSLAYLNHEEKVDRLVERAQEGMARLKALLEQKLDSVEDPKLRKKLMQPFVLMEINAQNPNINAPRFMKVASQGGLKRIRLDNINYFAFDVLPQGASSSAAFEPPTKIMFLTEDFDPSNLMDLLTLYHECFHAMQDTQYRDTFNHDKERMEYYLDYLKNQRVKMRVVNWEASAYAFELEAMDLLLDGFLREMAVDDHGFQVGDVLHQLNGRPDQASHVMVLGGLAFRYFEAGSYNPYQFSRSYVDGLANYYLDHEGVQEIHGLNMKSGRFFKYDPDPAYK